MLALQVIRCTKRFRSPSTVGPASQLVRRPRRRVRPFWSGCAQAHKPAEFVRRRAWPACPKPLLLDGFLRPTLEVSGARQRRLSREELAALGASLDGLVPQRRRTWR